MILKNFSIELAHKNKNAICIGIHPGTVDTALSLPFQRNVKSVQLFKPPHAASLIVNLINDLEIEDSGNLYGWDGQKIIP